MEKYLSKLIEQFKSSTGTQNVDVNSHAFIIEFSEWVKARKITGKEYTSFVEYMGAISDASVEIGKGKQDSIAIDTVIPMITPYSEGIKRTYGEILTADFRVYDNKPIIIRHDKGGNQLETLDTNYGRRFLTHNPYEENCIKNWEQLHNTGENITVGIFGNIYDKDLEQKIKQIEKLRDGLTDEYFKEEYVTESDSYYYVVSSARKVKELVKTR